MRERYGVWGDIMIEALLGRSTHNSTLYTDT